MAKTKADAAAAAPVRSTYARLVLKHRRALMFARAAKDDANAAIKARIKSAKDDGIPVQALEAALKLGRLDPQEARQLYVDTGRMFEAMWPGVLGQKDLFDSVEPATADEHAEVNRAEISLAGMLAGRIGETGQRDHRYEPGTAEAQAYERGWLRGNDSAFEEPFPGNGTDGETPGADSAEGDHTIN